jgi:hypothetical protein
MRSAWPARILLPAAQSLAEGSWLAVVYAALQAAGGEAAYIGPIELGLLTAAGMAWGRRRRWRSRTADALGLPLLALAAGLVSWLLDPDVRFALGEGHLTSAMSQHLPGLIGALAFWRGDSHRSPEEDATTIDRLLRWAVPGLAVPWLIGYAAASGQVEEDFAAAAFMGTVLFVGSAFTTLGLARLEAVRLSTGSDWRGNRSWLFMIIGLAVALTLLTLPAAAVLHIPARSLLSTLAVPLQTLFLLVVLLTVPIFLLAAVVADFLSSLLPGSFHIGHLSLPNLNISRGAETSNLASSILGIVVASIFLLELLVFAALVWESLRERWRRLSDADLVFEERSIVVPSSSATEGPPKKAPRTRAHHAMDDAAGAYLAALDALAADGRWPRREYETPAAHLSRTRSEGLSTPAFRRLALAYQLARYSPRPLPSREHLRASGRFHSLVGWLRASSRIPEG